LQAVAAGDIAHRAHGGHAHPPALDVPRNHNHERAEHVGAGLVETTSDRAVDPGRQVLQRAVPAERDGAGQGEDLIIVRPIRKSSMRRDIRRVITPYLEPGESIEICAVLYGAALAYGWGLIGGIRAITRNRTVPVYYAAVTGRRVLMVELSWYTLRPRGLALSDARQGASLRPLTRPAESQLRYAAVEYRGPSGQERQLWYNGVFEDEVGRQLLGLGPVQDLDRERILRRDRWRDRWPVLVWAVTLVVVLAAVLAGLHARGGPPTQRGATLKGPGSNEVYGVAFSPDGDSVATADRNGKTYLWDVATGTLTTTYTDPGCKGVDGVAFSPDGAYLAAADDNGSAYLWNTKWLST